MGSMWGRKISNIFIGKKVNLHGVKTEEPHRNRARENSRSASRNRYSRESRNLTEVSGQSSLRARDSKKKVLIKN